MSGEIESLREFFTNNTSESLEELFKKVNRLLADPQNRTHHNPTVYVASVYVVNLLSANLLATC